MQYFKPFFRDLQKACQLFSLPLSVSCDVVSYAELASAILLVVEVVFLDDSYSAFAQASLRQFWSHQQTSSYGSTAYLPASFICSRLFHLEEASVVVMTRMPFS